MKTIRLLSLLAVSMTFALVANAQLRVNEVGIAGTDFGGSAKWVELKNVGSAHVDATNLILCNFPAYPTIGSLNVLHGALNVPPDSFLVVEWADLGGADAEVGLYAAGSQGAFGNAANIRDYMEYGTSGHTREATAVEAGLWVAGETVMLPASGQSMSYVGGGTASSNWDVGTPTPGAENVTNVALDEPGNLPQTLRLHSAYPNPVRGSRTQVLFDLDRPSRVRIEVYDLLGRRQVATSDADLGAGAAHAVEVDTSSLPAGLYIYRIVAEASDAQSTAAGRLTVLG